MTKVLNISLFGYIPIEVFSVGNHGFNININLFISSFNITWNFHDTIIDIFPKFSKNSFSGIEVNLEKGVVFLGKEIKNPHYKMGVIFYLPSKITENNSFFTLSLRISLSCNSSSKFSYSGFIAFIS